MTKYIPCDQIAKLNTTIKSLACAVSELKEAVLNPDPGSGSGSALNEPIVLIGQSFYELIWDTPWIEKFGPGAVFDTYVQDPGSGKWLRNPIQAEADNAETPSKYTFNFGSPVNVVIWVS